MANFSEIFKSVLPIIERSAPSIGAIIGGHGGMAATFAISLLASVFGTHSADYGKIVSNILDDPQAEDKLNKLEKTHGKLLQGLDHDSSHKKTIEININ